ncbi:MAG: carbon storage regulator [Chloroflexi bacterium]|nr:carbon storage regulator [Chloroflexota bacterium]
MLVLTRKIDQGIVIAGNIYVHVLGVERDRVKIGISAPIDIPVLRLELVDRDREEQMKPGAVENRARKASNSSRSSVRAEKESSAEPN